MDWKLIFWAGRKCISREGLEFGGGAHFSVQWPFFFLSLDTPLSPLPPSSWNKDTLDIYLCVRMATDLHLLALRLGVFLLPGWFSAPGHGRAHPGV